MSLTAAASTMLRITNLRIAKMWQMLHIMILSLHLDYYNIRPIHEIVKRKNTFIFWAGPGAVGAANVLNMATAVLGTSIIPSFLCHP